ncbi:hypothetical protein SAMN05444422_103145 [Halobiforma haloterrestris]|uniref:Uncharacterized protein n=1 Tax=Natronobacterium haloterrestre TaxID=148448 RepID=A0A1I1F4M3_NATHA|nr:hypothetical protein [Halobiforma haloterrestris]SFB93892.1 hypothetical protein SAMN05444422_103145 [Halobiforma haloterrestris]
MRRTILEGVFAGGFVAVAAGVLIARENPATGYESSVYAGTPSATWAAFALALAIAVGTAIVCRGWYQGVGIGLGALTVTAIVSLPVIRNYRYAGMGDAMTHLGWTRDIVGGKLEPHELFYPAVHSIGSVLGEVGGIPVERALLVTMVVLFVPFLVFVPLVVRNVSGSAAAIGFGAIVSWMVLPVNNVATHMGVHTNSNALFFVPVVVFAVVAYLRRRAVIERLPLGLSPFSVLIFLSGVALLLIHPQQMVNVVVLVGAIALVQFLARRQYDDHPMVDHPTAYAHAAVLGLVFLAWSASNERFRDAISSVVYGLFAEDIGAGAEVGQREASLVEIGGSIGELFVALFLDAAIIGLIVALFVLAMWLGRTKVERETAAFVTYLALALIPLGGILALYFVGTPTMAFRQIGFIYVVVTILAGVAVAHLAGGLGRFVTRPGANAVVALALGACLMLGLLTVFTSPLIYDPGQHVTDQQFSGYESSFEHAAEDRPHAGLGYDPYRYDHGLYGLEREDVLSGATIETGEVDPDRFGAGNYSGAYHGVDYYLTVTEYDLTREVDVYQELYYSESSIAELESSPEADKVISNGEFSMYAVDGTE